MPVARLSRFFSKPIAKIGPSDQRHGAARPSRVRYFWLIFA